MSFDTLQFLDTVNPGPPDGEGRTVAQVLARAAAAERQSEAAEAAEAEARRAAALDRAETLAIQDRALGGPLAEISRAQAIAAEARDDIADLEAKLAKAHKKLAGAQHNVEFYAARMQAANDSAQRSAGADLLAPAKATLKAHREYVQASRAAWAAAQAGTPRQPRPFAGHGDARRSEPVTCKLCLKYGATSEQSFLIHADPSPEPAPAVPDADEAAWLASQTAERRTPGRRYAEISR